MSKHPKPIYYDEFRAKVLDKLKEPESWYVTREQFVEWSEVVAKTTTKITTLPNGKRRTNPFYRVTKTLLDWRERNRQLATLHVVMNDLVKEGILSRVDRIKRKTKYIRWMRRTERYSE